MFWIGLIVGILLTVAAWIGMYFWIIRENFNGSHEEYWDSVNVLYEATQNRECELQLVKDGNTIEVVEFLEE